MGNKVEARKEGGFDTLVAAFLRRSLHSFAALSSAPSRCSGLNVVGIEEEEFNASEAARWIRITAYWRAK